MTAEIAILNKTAVALATDSAVTISAGSTDQKIYDSADKLFELSRRNPIGIMIYNGMQFMQAPLSTVICEYRNQCRSFDRVEEGANDFLQFLNTWGSNGSENVTVSALRVLIEPVLDRMRERIKTKVEELIVRIRDGTEANLDVATELKKIRSEVILM
jgi:hypothetical protein